MEKISGNEFLKNLDNELNKKISDAKQNIISENEYEEYFGLEEKVNQNGLKETEFNRLSILRGKVTGSTVRVDTLQEYKRAMELLGYSQEDTKDILAHENAHANIAESLGAEHSGYSLILKKTEGGMKILPQALIFIPDEWSEKKQQKTHLKIINAPEEYGNSLSDGDKRDLDKINKDKII